MAKNPYQLNIRVDLKLKEEFFTYARENGSTVTELLVEYMKACVGRPTVKAAEINTDELADIKARLAHLELEVKKLPALAMK